MVDYIEDGIFGLIIGDVLGLPHEFKLREELIKNPVTTITSGGVWDKPIGTWSDDTSMTLATMDSLIHNDGKINLDDMMKRFIRYYLNGEYTQDGECFDCGNTTEQALLNYIKGKNVKNCGLKNEYNNGNGSLMRILPLAYLSDINYKNVEEVSSLTHAHIRSLIACNLYVEIAKEIMKGGEDTFCDYVSNASDTIQKQYKKEDELKYFQRIFNKDYEDGVTGRMHVVDTLETAIYSIRVAEDFKSSLLTAVNIGNDTDTVCAVCGGLAGLYYGYDDIPIEWLNKIRKPNIIQDYCDNFKLLI